MVRIVNGEVVDDSAPAPMTSSSFSGVSLFKWGARKRARCTQARERAAGVLLARDGSSNAPRTSETHHVAISLIVIVCTHGLSEKRRSDAGENV